MSEAARPSDTPPATKPGLSWDFFSQATDTPNVWAILETLLAMALFWFLTWYWETLWLLWSSIIVAPLFFLRSPKSIEIGVRLFEQGIFPIKWPENQDERIAAEARWEKRWVTIGIAIGLLVGIGAGYPIAKHLSVLLQYYSDFPKSLFLGYFVFVAVLLITVVVFMVVRIAQMGVLKSVSVGVTFPGAAIATTAAAGAAAVIAAAGVEAAWGLSALLTIFVVYFLLSKSISYLLTNLSRYLSRRTVEFSTIPNFASIPTAFFAIIVRTIATLQAASDGIPAISSNIWRTALCTAPGRLPELVPGSSVITLDLVVGQIRKGVQKRQVADIRLGLGVILFCLVPAWCYRLILKSTFWLWWVLLVWGRPLRTTSVEALYADTRGHAWAWLTRSFAIFAIAAAFAVPIADAYLMTIEGGARIMAQALFVFVDWTQFSPFQILALLSSAGILIIYFWSGVTIGNNAVLERKAEVIASLKWIGIFDNIRSGLGWLTIALLIVYIALLANAQRAHLFSVSPFFRNWLEWIYGAEYAAALFR